MASRFQLTALVGGFIAAGFLLTGLNAAGAELQLLVPITAVPAPKNAIAQSAESVGMTTMSTQTTRAVSTDSADDTVNRVGEVRLDADQLMPVSPETGQRVPLAGSIAAATVAVDFFPDAQYDIQIQSESRPGPQILSLIGKGEGQDLANFSLTVTPESYLITFDDPETAMRYRVVGDTESGKGKVTEIDLTNLPPIKDSPPLGPPAE